MSCPSSRWSPWTWGVAGLLLASAIPFLGVSQGFPGLPVLSERPSEAASVPRAPPPAAPFSTPTGREVAPSASAPNWLEPCSACSPTPREGGAMVYDAADGYVLLFGGGAIGGGALGDTWRFQGGLWTEYYPNPAPSARGGASVVYDWKDGEVVLFGGYNANDQLLNDTWTYKGGTWTNITTSHAPSPRYAATMAYDEADGYAVLFGGCSLYACDAVLGDTWTFSGGTWNELTTAVAPPARAAEGLTFDNATGVVLLFGGQLPRSSLGGTWEFSAGTWTQLFPATQPYGRANFLLDNGTLGVVMFGGTSNGSLLADTWTWVAGNWVQAAPATSPPGDAYLTSSQGPSGFGVMFFSGQIGTSVTWTYENSAAPLSAAATVVPTSGPTPLSVAFAGGASGGAPPYAWSWHFGDGGSSALQDPTHVYNAVGVYTALLWVNDSAGSSVEVAAPAVTVLSKLVATASATPLGGAAPLTVSFSGSGSAGTPPYGWLWRFGTGGISPTQDPSYTFSRPGTYTVWFWVNDSGGQSATATLPITVTPSISVSGLAVPASGGAPLNVSFTGTATGGSGTYTAWLWDFGDGGTSILQDPHHTYSAGGSFVATVSVTDSEGSKATGSLTPIEVSPSLSVLATADPTSGAPPLTVDLTSLTSGGSGGIRYLWSFGDGDGATTENASHTYDYAGTYIVWVNVSDSYGTFVQSNKLTITVFAPGSNSQSYLGVPGQEFALLLIGLFALVALGVLVFVFRRRKERTLQGIEERPEMFEALPPPQYSPFMEDVMGGPPPGPPPEPEEVPPGPPTPGLPRGPPPSGPPYG